MTKTAASPTAAKTETTPQFQLQINFTKAYKDPEDENFAFIEGIASGPEVDLTGERMSLSALQSMVESFKRSLIAFRDAHKHQWNSVLGGLVELYLTEDNHLAYKSRIDLNLSGSRDLWYRLTVLGEELGVSVGGEVIRAGKEWVSELGREIFTYFEVALNELSITANAAYQYSFANAVTKSLSQKGDPMKIMQTLDKEALRKSDEALEQAEPVAAPDEQPVEVPAAGPVAEQAQVEAPAEEAPTATPPAEEAPAEAVADAPAEPEAEAPAEAVTEKSAPTVDASVIKSAILGDYTEANMAENAVYDLAWNLQYFVWSAMMNADTTRDEKIATVDAALAEFHQLILTIVTALTPASADAVAATAKALQDSKPGSIAKSLGERDSKVAEIQKALDAKTLEVAAIQKSLAAAIAEKAQVVNDLATANAELDLQKARKVTAFNEGARKAIIEDVDTTPAPSNSKPKKLQGVY